MEKIILASNNAGKLLEFQHGFSSLGIRLISQQSLGIAEIEEPHCTFIENALAKARHASAIGGMPALADDSGLCVPSLGGAPGVHSARYALQNGEAKSDVANNARLVKEIAGKTTQAYYYCVLVLVRSPQDPQPFIAEGTLHGQIIREARGAGGFGYDPHFYLSALGKTAAELSLEEKNKISHRAQALTLLFQKIKSVAV